jgi:glycosyltransferase involved in cell wall biosynthesis
VKILHVTPFYEPAAAYGGMARAPAGLCRALAGRGHEVVVATALLTPADARDETRDGVRVRRFRGPAFLRDRLVPYGFGLARFLRELRGIDVAHLHGHRSGLVFTARRVLAAAGVPWIFTAHGTYPSFGQWTLAKRLLDAGAGEGIVAGAAAVVALSAAEAADLPRPARVIPNGVAACGVPGSRARPPTPRILFVGSDRFPRKRAAALPELLVALPSAELHLVGRFSAGFLARMSAFGARVTAHGVLAGDALATAYADADVLVHPAVQEAFGLVPFEAALAGTASVVAGGHGCGEWFGRAGGCVVPPDDARALAGAVEARLADPALRAREAGAVARFAARELTWERAAEATEALYVEAVAH